jgi:hypothetical protein
MTVADMHIAVNQGVQKIASHQVDVLLPQEIDFELNKAQDKFVKNRYNQFGNKYSRGFEGSQKRIDDLRNLVTETTVPTQYKGQIADNIFVDTAILPEDDGYMFLLNQRSLVVHNNCDSIQDCVIEGIQPQTWLEIDFDEFSPSNFGGAPGNTFEIANSSYVSFTHNMNTVHLLGTVGNLALYNSNVLKVGMEITTSLASVIIPPGTIITQISSLGIPAPGAFELTLSQIITTPGASAAAGPAEFLSIPATLLNNPIDEILIACIDDTGTAIIASPFNQPLGFLACNGDFSNYLDSQYWNPGWSVFENTTPMGTSLTYTSANGGKVFGIALPFNWTLDLTPGVLNSTYPGCFVYATRVSCNNNILYPADKIDYFSQPTDFDSVPTNTRSCNDIKYTTSSVNRYAQLDDIYTLLQDPFNKTKHTSPLTTIVGHNIDIYTDETFYVPKVKITYIKKPRSIDSTSGSVIACELAEHTHQEIVDMAVASILAEIADPRYQTARMEEMRSE